MSEAFYVTFRSTNTVHVVLGLCDPRTACGYHLVVFHWKKTVAPREVCDICRRVCDLNKTPLPPVE